MLLWWEKNSIICAQDVGERGERGFNHFLLGIPPTLHQRFVCCPFPNHNSIKQEVTRGKVICDREKCTAVRTQLPLESFASMWQLCQGPECPNQPHLGHPPPIHTHLWPRLHLSSGSCTYSFSWTMLWLLLDLSFRGISGVLCNLVSGWISWT